MAEFKDRLPSAPSPRGSRSIKRILDAAARLFGAEGYQGASMNAVAAAAGVSKGLLHYHFRSKEHLLIEAQRSTFREIHRRFEERIERGERGLETVLEAVDALWAAVLEMRTWTPFMVEIMSLAAQGGEIREHLDTFYAESDQMMSSGIDKLFSGHEGELIIGEQRLAYVVRIVLHGLTVELAYARNEEDVARIKQGYADLRNMVSQAALTQPHPEVEQ